MVKTWGWFCLILGYLFSANPVYSEKMTFQESSFAYIQQLKQVNAELLSSDNEELINPILEQRDQVLSDLMQHLRGGRSSALKFELDMKTINFLRSRIKINRDKQNELAVSRDQFKLNALLIENQLFLFLDYLIDSSRNYLDLDSISLEAQKKLDQFLAEKLPDYEVASTQDSPLLKALSENYADYQEISKSYHDILIYVTINPRQIASVYWFQEFSLLSVISYLNQFDFMLPVNYKLAPFKVDAGGIIVALLIFFTIYCSYPLVFRCSSWLIENYLIDQNSEQQEMIYHEVRRPVRALLVFFGINLGAIAFFYKTDYRQIQDNIAFIVYSILIVWLLFKVIDSIVLVQIQNLSKRNKELRKGLFNLAIQSGKILTIIVVLATGLSHFGISLTAIFSTLGVGGLAFALAAKDTLSNLFGGITILFDDVFRMGDWVKIGDVEGTVAEIGLRSTTVRTFDNALITIPNSQVSVASVMNWDRRAIGRRIKMYVPVTYDSDMQDVRQALADLRTMLKDHPDIANPMHKPDKQKRSLKFTSHEDTHGIKSTQLVFLDRYNESSMDILIYCFARTVNWAEWLAVKEDILFKIEEILRQNNLQFAYPTQVRIHKADEQFDLDI